MKLSFPPFFHADIFWKNDPHVIILLVKYFGNEPDYICKSSGFIKATASEAANNIFFMS